MLESLVAWVLNNYIGEYLENLNTDQLSVAVLQGQVELENVPLKKTALRKFDVPISVKAGVLGKLVLSIPLRVGTEPWKVNIRDLYVLLEPSDNKYDVEFDEEYQKNKKVQQLEALEAFHKKQIAETKSSRPVEEPQTSSSGWFTYSASLVAAIVENIQLTVNNVHIRYEDDNTINGRSFACGVKINHVIVQSTNSKWKTGFVERRETDNLFKLLDLSGVAMYWDSGVDISRTPETLREVIQLLEAKSPMAGSHSYVLSPVSAKVRMERNTSKFPLKTRPAIPRFKFDLEPENLNLEMSKGQLLEMRLLGREWARYERARKNRKWRPKEPIKEKPRRWWKFAIQCQLEWIRKRRERESWSYALSRAKTICAYSAAYNRRLNSVGETKKKEEGGDSILIKQVERDPEYSYEDLHVLRDTVFRKTMKKLRDEKKDNSDGSDEEFTTIASSETFETPDEEISSSSLSTAFESPTSEAIGNVPQKPPSGGGLSGWVYSWFGGTQGEEPKENEDFITPSTSDNAMSTQGWWSAGSSALPQYLRDAEKQLEEGILDVLNESWDDSTLLRRDTLLARVQLWIKSLTLSFLDDSAISSNLQSSTASSCTKVLAGQLSQVYAGIEMSPRHHSNSVQLTVGDLSVHSELLKSAPTESLFWSSGMSSVFALGKAAIDRSSPPNLPLLQCFYQRKVAKFVAKHTLSMEFSPISIMYKASALETLIEFFEGTVPSDSQHLSKETEGTDVIVASTPDIYLAQLSASIKVPSLSVELRSELSLDPGEAASGDGLAFGCAHLDGMTLSLKKSEPHRVEMDLRFDSLGLEDLVEGEKDPSLQYLIRTADSLSRKTSTFVSNSCPDLSSLGDGDFEMTPRSSLPKATTVSPVSRDLSSNSSQTPKISRRGSLERKREAEDSGCALKILLVDPRHPKFNTLYRGRSCQISGTFDSLDVNVNPQTWVLVFDFLGIVEPPPIALSKEEVIKATNVTTDRKEVTLKTNKLKLTMNQPKQKDPIGTIFLNETELIVEVNSNGLLIDGNVSGLVLEDGSSEFGKLYHQKLFVPRKEQSKLKVLKYNKPDPELLRSCDLMIEVTLPSAVYTHTQRFFMDLLNYWLHLIDLIDYLSQMKAAFAGQSIEASTGHGSRVMLKIDVLSSASLILPVNSLSSELLVAKMSNLKIGNNFLFASQTVTGCEESLKASTATGFDEDAHDCLLDIMHVDCDDLVLYPGYQLSEDDEPPRIRNYSLEEHSPYLRVYLENISIITKPYKLSLLIQRNLDGNISKNVPDLAIFVHVVEERFRLTVDSYKRVRGFLFHNLAEELPPPPKAPVFSQNPKNVTVLSGKVWKGLSFQLEMTKVELDCLWPKTDSIENNSWESLGEIDFAFAQLSFETLSDQSSELDLIITSGTVLDTRFEDAPANKRANVFPKILGRRPKSAKEKSHDLMAEVHFLMGKNMESNLTVVLSNVQVMGIMDWIMRAKDFLASDVDFMKEVPEKSPQIAAIANPFHPGVIQKIPIPLQALEGMKLKLNLLNCAAVLPEDCSSKTSMAFHVEVSCVLYLSDRNGVPSVRLEGNSLRIGTCQVSYILDTLSQVTEPFSGTIEIVQERLTQTLQKCNFSSGLGTIVPPERRLEITVADIVIRLSYRDYLICDTILKALLGEKQQTAATTPNEAGPDIATKANVKINSFSVWLLDDFQDTLFPLMRFGIRRGEFEQQLTSSSPEGLGSLTIYADYFNQKVYGWEPLIEAFDVGKIGWCISPKQRSLQMDILAQNSVLDVTITQTFVQQALQFSSRWPEVKKHLSSDFRSGVGKFKTDHLPYILKNDTGSPLKFTTYLSTDGGGKRANWRTAEVGHSVSFAFPNRHYSIKGPHEMYSPHQIIVKVEGFQEISPVSVDCVGTYFRSAKFPTEMSSSLSHKSSFARIVVDVTTDQDGRKLVTVRSSLTLVNGLFDSLQITLENMTTFVNDTKTISLAPGEVAHAPLHYAISVIHARPTRERWALNHCAPIHWERVVKKGTAADDTRLCKPSSSGEGESFYRMCVRVQREHYPEIDGANQVPGHTITFYPPLTLLNLLPVELGIQIGRIHARIPPGHRTAFTAVDPTKPIAFKLNLENFEMNDSVSITPTTTEEEKNVDVYDEKNRKLRLTVTSVVGRGKAVQMSISVPFWIVNRSSLAIVVKQEATPEPSAGQFKEHEQARFMLPLMFSFAERDSPDRCSIRLGKTSEPGWDPEWTRPFVLEQGISERKLTCRSEKHSMRPPKTYNVGIEVRPGQGIYKNTKIVLLTPLIQLENRSRHRIVVAQKQDIKDKNFSLSIAPNCSVAWHWPRNDLDPLLCVQREGHPAWSSGFILRKLSAFHLNIRGKEKVPTFLRVEIVLHGGMYYVIFSDADNLPAPMRIDNFSEIPILYYQAGTSTDLKATLQPGSSVDYNWDDLVSGEKKLNFVVFDGREATYDPSELGGHHPLLYENNFFIELKLTFSSSYSGLQSNHRSLVLEARKKDGAITLKTKDRREQCQLWRMSARGHLINVGIPKIGRNQDEELVLDVNGTPDSNSDVPLVLARHNENRNLTQQWTFTKDNRMTCGFPNLFVQAGNPRLLSANTPVFLGPTKVATQCSSGVPDEQWLEKGREKPGSGRLGIEVTHKGPTRVIEITDLGLDKSKSKQQSRQAERKKVDPTIGMELTLSVNLYEAIGFSLINASLEELIYCRLSTVQFVMCRRLTGEYSLKGHVFDVQADNQLWRAERWPLLYIKKANAFDEKTGQIDDIPIPSVRYEIQWTPLKTYDSFQTFRVQVTEVILQLEEILLWKLVEFFSLGRGASSDWPSSSVPSTPATPSASASNYSIAGGRKFIRLEEPDMELVRPDPSRTRRCYFGDLQLELPHLYLTVLAVSRSMLPNNLRLLRDQWNLTLVRFESAPVSLRPFHQQYYFETLNFLADALQKHYSKQLKGAAVRILGTVDFLGNPLGLFQDFESGIKELIIEGSVSGFVGGVGHGLSNSVAKLSSSLSEGVGKLTRDSAHSRSRDHIRAQQYQEGGSAVSHVFSGVKGLGLGILGGATSIVTQPVEGFKKDGIGGIATGVGKGLVNTISRPLQGVLDLTTGVATAAKEGLSSNAGYQSSRFPSNRLRVSRVTHSMSGTIPPFSADLSEAQKLLTDICDRGENEICLSVHLLLSDSPTQPTQVFRALVCTERVYFVITNSDGSNISLVEDYSRIECCNSVLHKDGQQSVPVLKIHLKSSRNKDPDEKRPFKHIRCDSLETTETMVRHILHAKQLHDELRRRIPVAEDFNPDPVPTYSNS